MTKVFITGDRSMHPILGVLPALGVVHGATKLGEDVEIFTGTNDGFEFAVRLVCEQLELPVSVLEQSVGEDGKPDWDARHAQLVDFDKVVLVHGDPMASSIGKSLMSLVGDDVLELVS